MCSLVLAAGFSAKAYSQTQPELDCRIVLENLPCSDGFNAIIAVTTKPDRHRPHMGNAVVTWDFPQQCFARPFSGELAATAIFRDYEGIRMAELYWHADSIQAFEARNDDPLGGGVMWEAAMFSRYLHQNFIRIDQQNQVSLVTYDGVQISPSGNFEPSQSSLYNLTCTSLSAESSAESEAI